ncbi:hypothetical protein WOLCODRAFT_90277 [Wolfiporia cocos MD-104 SS10]|uniref:IPT/TIG domain-containing protein n=1 Tax=Wolfiporia cocos (strain MD-104) TaxID=742152 RepID=A0A2H3JZX1_WOLCO|nr:hypothetical protein WOLCODRAFT_90277 [Wolfiporia cocos MD-104 SS10]
MAQEFNPETITFEQLLNTYSPPPAPPAPASPVPLALDPTQALSVPQQSPPFLLFNQQNPPPITALPPPRIHRLIPSSGPTYGGIEVTVLGANFHPSMQLNCTFGGTTSSSTQRWSDNTLVCMLPPSPTAGVVNVWFEGLHKQEDGTPPCLFTYTDETDKALMELALQVVGLKMTGKIEDARNVAMRIVGNTGSDDSSGGARSSNAMQLAGELDIPRDLRHLLLSRAGSNGDFETVILDFLSVLDIAIDRPTLSLASSISHQTASGQTLLHLAVMAKFPALVRFLIAHEIDIDVRDKNGCTALFLAAVVRSTECAKALIEAGAALDIVNALGKTPEDVAPEGFFDAIFVISDDDEAAWGDVEEESESDEPARPAPPRRARKSFVRRRRSSHFTRDITPQSKTPQRPAARPAESKSKKALEAGMADEKQVASFMDMFSRTLAQWQHPQGMIPNMPNLPLPHLPHLPLPAIPAWNALPQMPAVFPVLVPITAISQLWGEKRVGEKSAGESEDDKDAGARSKQAVPTTQDWRAFWEKLVTQGGESPQTHDEISDAPPPAYSPRRSDSCELPADVKVPLSEPIASSSGVMLPPSSERIVSRHIGYEPLPLPEQEVNAYAYRPAHKSLRKQQKKQDRMLFWMDDELEQMNSDFTKWLNCWRQTIHTVAIHAYDLPNYPHDRLATHWEVIFIKVERRPGIASVSRSFRMVAGRVLARSEFVDYMRENECSEEDIKDWEDDNRGDHTVHIIIVFHGLMRMLWFTIRDLTKDREGSENSSVIDVMAQIRRFHGCSGSGVA